MTGGSREARRLAVAILEVLAGARTPAEAASAVGVSLPRFYALESRAVEGLLAGCEPRKLGKQKSPESRLEQLRREVERLRRECARSLALLRNAQRSVGLSLPDRTKKPKKSKGKRRRKPVARGLQAAAALQSEPARSDQPGQPSEQQAPAGSPA